MITVSTIRIRFDPSAAASNLFVLVPAPQTGHLLMRAGVFAHVDADGLRLTTSKPDTPRFDDSLAYTLVGTHPMLSQVMGGALLSAARVTGAALDEPRLDLGGSGAADLILSPEADGTLPRKVGIVLPQRACLWEWRVAPKSGISMADWSLAVSDAAQSVPAHDVEQGRMADGATADVFRLTDPRPIYAPQPGFILDPPPRLQGLVEPLPLPAPDIGHFRPDDESGNPPRCVMHVTL